MHTQQVAVLFIGNAGSGKSTLLSQIGGDFKSGTSFRSGFTKDVKTDPVTLNGEPVVLIDVPGLFEPDNKQTQSNAQKINEALKKPYSYKIFFVLKAESNGPDNREMVMMAKVNECVRQATGAKVKFGVIINQIADDQVYQMYYEEAVENKFQKHFSSLTIPGFSFDIDIGHVALLSRDKTAVQQNGLRDAILDAVKLQEAVSLNLEKPIHFSNKDLDLYSNGLKSSGKPSNSWIRDKLKYLVNMMPSIPDFHEKSEYHVALQHQHQHNKYQDAIHNTGGLNGVVSPTSHGAMNQPPASSSMFHCTSCNTELRLQVSQSPTPLGSLASQPHNPSSSPTARSPHPTVTSSNATDSPWGQDTRNQNGLHQNPLSTGTAGPPVPPKDSQRLVSNSATGHRNEGYNIAHLPSALNSQPQDPVSNPAADYHYESHNVANPLRAQSYSTLPVREFDTAVVNPLAHMTEVEQVSPNRGVSPSEP
ncbi:hypothetical protein BGX26_009467 [Mortierella sp. AD094]|nr:hypothetical protein BGX26_009467 [Mortierella sp. AD094]